MSDLLKQLRKSRQIEVEVGRFVFYARRPTDVEAALLHKQGVRVDQVAADYVTGWANVQARDVVPSTKSDDAVDFDPDLWREWCADKPEFWGPISEAVMQAYRRHSGQREQAAKN